MSIRKPIFDAVATARNKPWTGDSVGVGILDTALDTLGVPRDNIVTPVPASKNNTLTARILAEVVNHEAIVQEAYKDSEGIWTWAIGVTNASGHTVNRYKDNPQPISKCLEVYLWLVQNNYFPDVLKAFNGRILNENQLAAALSFHYNTGAINKTEWVKLYLGGRQQEAREFLETHYLNGGDLKKRRMQEAALFFDAKWTTDGKATVFGVKKPSYTPDWSSGRRIDIMPDLRALLGG